YFALAFIRAKLGDAAGAARDAEELPRILPDNPDSYVQAAFFLIQCAGASPGQKADFYDRAMNVLREAGNGHKYDRRALDNPELTPLRDPEDFQRLRQPPKPPVAG